MRLKRTIISVGLLSLSVLPAVAQAQVEFDPSKNDPGHTSIKAFTFLSGGTDPVGAAINIVNIALSFLGLASVIMFLYAGIVWFKSGDNEEELKKAKDIMVGTIIGVILTLSAYGISLLTFNQLSNITVQTDDQYLERTE